MPIYEYQCEACQHHLEALQKISDPPLRKCPECGKAKLTRLISPPVFRLKGSGWYETDFKSEKENKRNLAVEKDEAPASSANSTDNATASPTARPADGQPAKLAETRPQPQSQSQSQSQADKTDQADNTARPAPAAATPRKAASRPKAKARPRPARKRAR